MNLPKIASVDFPFVSLCIKWWPVGFPKDFLLLIFYYSFKASPARSPTHCPKPSVGSFPLSKWDLDKQWHASLHWGISSAFPHAWWYLFPSPNEVCGFNIILKSLLKRRCMCLVQEKEPGWTWRHNYKKCPLFKWIGHTIQ